MKTNKLECLKAIMRKIIKLKRLKQLIGFTFALLCFYGQTSLAAERWQIVVLSDTNFNPPIDLPALVDFHSTISQGLTIALTHADFDVLNPHYLGLPNCILEDCSTLTDQTIQHTAMRSAKEVNLALLYQLNAFKQRLSSTQKWYFSLSGRLLDLQSGTQQDAFSVDNWVNSPSKNCIGDCFSNWLKHNLSLLAQDLGTVLSEKLDALPRRFHYQLNLNNFTSNEIQQIDSYLKSLEGYVADTLLGDSQNENHALAPATSRTYQYISELSASELAAQLEKANQQFALPIKIEYDNAQRQFTLMPKEQTDYWATVRQFVAGLFLSSAQKIPVGQSSEESIPQKVITPLVQEIDKQKEANRDQQTWQQASEVNTLESYQQYLTIWPIGQYVIQAQAAIQKFEEDANAWQQASNQQTTQAFQQYLTAQPQGKYKSQAKQQLALLRVQQQRIQKQQENKALADDYYYQQKNYPEALYYYQQAANLGEVSSQFLLATMFEQGKGTEQNMHMAANWYSKAASQGHRQAQATLGFMYSKGNEVKQDYSQAVYWYQQAAEQGHINAQYNLAYLFSLGKGVIKNYQQAAYWYEKSAIQGDADAQNSLGKLYERGLGVNPNLAKAKSLYQQASAQGHQIAQLNLQMLNN